MATSQRYFFPPPGKIKTIQVLNNAWKIKYLKKIDVWVKKGDVVLETVNHPSRVGYVIACAPTLNLAIKSAKQAVKRVMFVVTQ